MSGDAPYRNGQKPNKMKVFADDSVEELERKAEKWLLEKGESIVIICGGYFVAFMPVQADLFQSQFKFHRSIVIWYREV